MSNITTHNNIVEADTDEDDEDEFFSNVGFNNEILQRLKQNDPSILGLHIPLRYDENGDYLFINNIDWKKDGDCISNNTHLKRLYTTYDGSSDDDGIRYILGEEGHNLPTRQKLQDFFSCVYQNSSINEIIISEMTIDGDFGGGLIEGLSGHTSLTELEIGYAGIGSVGCRAIGNILKHPESKLKELHLPGCKLDIVGLSILCNAIVGNNKLKKLCLKKNSITDQGLDVLVSALCGSSVKALDLSYNYSISSRGWHTFLGLLEQTSIKNLILEGNMNRSNEIDDTCLALLANIRALTSLDLSGNAQFISISGWRTFFSTIQRRGTQLVKLDIARCQIGNRSSEALGSLLSSMNSLKELDMSHENITSQGWQTLFTSLHGSNLHLVKLNLSGNTIDDEGIQLLIPLLSNKIYLKILNLSSNKRVTPSGWQALSDFLRSPNFVLERLFLDNNNIDDDTLITFASALTDNKTLEWLDVEQVPPDEDEDEDDNDLDLITKRGWLAVSNLVCNKRSILDTYTSNHVLRYLGDYYCDGIGDEMFPYLQLNENKDKAEVARQKILQTHFSGKDTSNMQELLDMELEVMPTAISWIGRPVAIHWKGENVSGLSLLYNIVRRLPDLFDSGAAQKRSMKRKRN